MPPYRQREIDRLLRPGLIGRSRVDSRALQVAETVIRQQVYRVEQAAERRLIDQYQAAFEDIRRVADAGGSVTNAWRDDLMARVRRRVDELTDSAAAMALRAAVAAFYGGYYGRVWQIDMQTAPSVNVKMRVPDALAGVLEEDVFDDVIRALLGRSWRAQFADQMDVLVPQIKIAINTGMAEGEGMDQIMVRVRNVIGVPTDRRRGYTANFNRVRAIVQTNVIAASNNGAVAAYRANSDVVGGYQWLAARDERVCPLCQKADGRVYKLGDNERPPLHIGCRCAVIPVIRDDVDQIDSADYPRERFGDWVQGRELNRFLTDFLTTQF